MGLERGRFAEGRREGRPGTCGLVPARRVAGFNECDVFAEGRVAGLDAGRLAMGRFPERFVEGAFETGFAMGLFGERPFVVGRPWVVSLDCGLPEDP